MKFRAKNKSTSKYHNKKIKINGIQFDSTVEGCRYVQLKELEDAGIISNLRRQVSYEIIPAMYKDEVKHLKTKDKIIRKLMHRPTMYKADFVYEKNGQTVVEDVKGSMMMITPDFKIKRKLMMHVHGIDVQIVIIPYKEQRRILQNLSPSCLQCLLFLGRILRR